jgi:hypothetical protein
MKPEHPPSFLADAFNCPLCETYAAQTFFEVYIGQAGGVWGVLGGFMASKCARCDEATIWHNGVIVHPRGVLPGVAPLEEMPDNVRTVYEEAREVGAISTRSAVALLRLALQMLVDDLVPGPGKIDQKIGELVKRGLDPKVQQAMDVLRVYGNNAVHPGRIEVEAEPQALDALFVLLNMIVEQVIVRAAQVTTLYESLPQGALKAIERRDGKNVEA